MPVTPGARFAQLQPVIAQAVGGKDGTASPYVLFTVPEGQTYRLRYTSVSLCVNSDSTFAAATGFGAFASIQDSLGNTYAEAEAFVAGPGQSAPNSQVLPCDNAPLPAGAVVSLVVSHGTGAVAGFYVHAGGGAVWRTA